MLLMAKCQSVNSIYLFYDSAYSIRMVIVGKLADGLIIYDQTLYSKNYQ